MRKGLKEVLRSTKGNTYISVGLVTDSQSIGCPDCDTIYIILNRDGREDLFLAITPEEALLISNLLDAAVFSGVYKC